MNFTQAWVRIQRLTSARNSKLAFHIIKTQWNGSIPSIQKGDPYEVFTKEVNGFVWEPLWKSRLNSSRLQWTAPLGLHPWDISVHTTLKLIHNCWIWISRPTTQRSQMAQIPRNTTVKSCLLIILFCSEARLLLFPPYSVNFQTQSSSHIPFINFFNKLTVKTRLYLF